MGTVSYRSVGSGQPLVMIMGFSGSQDAWSPTLVNALAVRHQVIIFDNSGIGQTTTPPGTPTISAMADQTAALISTLHLRHPDVLGWSLGGMIAQALAELHPADVRRLVLCATVPGNGKALVPSASASMGLYDAATSGNVSALMSWIFPQNQKAAATAYINAILGYPNFFLPSAAVDAAQYKAADGWIVGTEPEGHVRIKVPTLIGVGADDMVFNPVNSKRLAQAIKGSKLVIYPDAGHAFMMQDAKAWAAKVNAFLG
jgi:pimeloyl-ACP methyl ester carboxylesterase